MFFCPLLTVYCQLLPPLPTINCLSHTLPAPRPPHENYVRYDPQEKTGQREDSHDDNEQGHTDTEREELQGSRDIPARVEVVYSDEAKEQRQYHIQQARRWRAHMPLTKRWRVDQRSFPSGRGRVAKV